MSRKTLLALTFAALVPLAIVAQQATEHLDLNVLHKIKTAELGGGGGNGGGGGGRGGNAGAPPIMNTMYNLTDRFGPRLTNSPQFRRAEVIAERHHQDPSEIMNLCCEIGLSVYETNPALQPVPRGNDSVPDPRPKKTRAQVPAQVPAPVAPGDDSTPRSAKPSRVSATGPRRRSSKKLPPVDLTPDAQPTDGTP